MTLIFRCGHQLQLEADSKVTQPVCLECGEKRIARTRGVGAPRFVGVALGPCATTQALPAIPVNLRQSVEEGVK